MEPRAFDALHGRLLADKSLQFDLPSIPPRKPPPEWLDWFSDAFGFIAPVLKWGFWLGLAVLGLLLVYFLGRELLGVRAPRWARRKAKVAEPWRPEAGAARQLLAEADGLAAEGRYGEAVHLLLMRSIEDIEARRPRLVRPASTSREIAAFAELPEAARPAFRRIAEVVEQALFAGGAVDQAAFADCRKAYSDFALPEAWGGGGVWPETRAA